MNRYIHDNEHKSIITSADNKNITPSSKFSFKNIYNNELLKYIHDNIFFFFYIIISVLIVILLIQSVLSCKILKEIKKKPNKKKPEILVLEDTV